MKCNRYLLALLLVLALPAWADTPVGPMNYQGRLLNNGIPVGYPSPTTANFIVKVYDAANGGTLKYQETHSSVTVDDGVYNFLVGTKPKDNGDSTWSVELWNCCINGLYMEITANGETLLPRSRLAAAPYAFQANLALTTNNALALGGKSAAQYDSTLQAICVSGKGKWLELANAGAGTCLGVGSSFPGPTRVNWNTLTANNNFSNLDLSRADISGINFGSPSATNMTNTIFDTTTYSVAGMSGANLTGTTWNSAVATDVSAVSVSASTNLAKATMKNMDLSKWNLSLITTQARVNLFSAAYLSACPSAVFGYIFPNTSGVWKCNLMRAAGSQYFMVGPYANLSTTSAAAVTSYGEILLDVDTFDNTDTSAADFRGVTLTQGFLNGYLYTANLTSTTLRNISFTNTNFNGTFINAKLQNVYIGSSISFNNGDWTGASLSNVRIDTTPMNLNLTKGTLEQVDFNGGIQGGNFTDAVLEDVRIGYVGSAPTFVRTRILGNFNIASMLVSQGPSWVFQDIDFVGATVTGALTDINFTGSVRFKNVVFKNLDLCSVSMPLAGAAPHAEFTDVRWEGPVECPDGTDLLGIPAGATPLYANTCNYLTRTSTPIAVGSCTIAVPGALQ